MIESALTIRRARMLAVAVLLSFPLGACSRAPTPTKQTSAPAESGLRQIDPAALKTAIEGAAREMLIPGAVVLLRTPQGEVQINYGTTKLGEAIPPSPDTYFRAASNTKTMTSAVILQLAQEGKLSLDDPISKYIATVPDGANITIAQLLEMRSGLYNFTQSPLVWKPMDTDPAKVWSPEKLLAIAFAHKPNFAPGKSYEYSNTNYVLLGLVIEKLDGKPLAQSMRDRLFTPLGMHHTFLPAANVNTLPDPFSYGYLYGSASNAILDVPAYSAEQKAAARDGKWKPRDFTNLNHSFAAGAGAVVSTASDLSIWIKALVSGQVLDADYQHRFLDSPHPEDPTKPNGQKYGYGITQISWGPNTIYFHGGETAGFNSFMGYDPNNQVTLVVWTNLTVSLDLQPTANTLMLKVLDQIYSVSPLTPPPSN